jgi:hypothetical protein
MANGPRLRAGLAQTGQGPDQCALRCIRDYEQLTDVAATLITIGAFATLIRRWLEFPRFCGQLRAYRFQPRMCGSFVVDG